MLEVDDGERGTVRFTVERGSIKIEDFARGVLQETETTNWINVKYPSDRYEKEQKEMYIDIGYQIRNETGKLSNVTFVIPVHQLTKINIFLDNLVGAKILTKKISRDSSTTYTATTQGLPAGSNPSHIQKPSNIKTIMRASDENGENVIFQVERGSILITHLINNNQRTDTTPWIRVDENNIIYNVGDYQNTLKIDSESIYYLLHTFLDKLVGARMLTHAYTKGWGHTYTANTQGLPAGPNKVFRTDTHQSTGQDNPYLTHVHPALEPGRAASSAACRGH
jgi:hypothetical protein